MERLTLPNGRQEAGLRVRIASQEVVRLPAVAEFKVDDHMRPGTSQGVTIGVVGDTVQKEFYGRTESGVPEADITIYRCRTSDGLSSTDCGAHALAAIAVDEETVLGLSCAHLWELLKLLQGAGPECFFNRRRYLYVLMAASDGSLLVTRCRWCEPSHQIQYDHWGIYRTRRLVSAAYWKWVEEGHS